MARRRAAEADELPPFGYDSICPKCGYGGEGGGVSTRHVRALADDRSFRRERGVEEGWPAGEHLRRTCERCGYAWAEGCLT